MPEFLYGVWVLVVFNFIEERELPGTWIREMDVLFGLRNISEFLGRVTRLGFVVVQDAFVYCCLAAHMIFIIGWTFK